MSIQERLKKEWDNIAKARYEDLRLQKDVSFETILKPAFDKYLESCDLDNVLDVGCGVGVHTNYLASQTKKVTGIDMSDVSIRYANENKAVNATYYSVSLEEFTSNELFSTIVSNMTLMDMAGLENLFCKFYRLLTDGGCFIFTITHPIFWPIYWGYNQKEDFDYNKESEIKQEFKTRNKVYRGLVTTHFHRPIQFYVEGLIRVGFHLMNFEELCDFPRRKKCNYPRFLIIKCIKLPEK